MRIKVEEFELIEMTGESPEAEIMPVEYSVEMPTLVLTAGVFLFFIVILIIWRN